MLRLLGIASIVLAASGCRTDCQIAADCDRNEICESGGICKALPGAAPLGTITPGEAMEVVAVFPPPDSVNAPATTPIIVITTRAVAPDTVLLGPMTEGSRATFFVGDARQRLVTGRIDFLVDPSGFILLPDAPLEPGGSYNVQVDNNIQDGNKKFLREGMTWTFKVAETR